MEEDAAWVPMFSRSHLFVKGDRIASFTPHWAGYNDTQYVYQRYLGNFLDKKVTNNAMQAATTGCSLHFNACIFYSIKV